MGLRGLGACFGIWGGRAASPGEDPMLRARQGESKRIKVNQTRLSRSERVDRKASAGPKPQLGCGILPRFREHPGGGRRPERGGEVEGMEIHWLSRFGFEFSRACLIAFEKLSWGGFSAGVPSHGPAFHIGLRFPSAPLITWRGWQEVFKMSRRFFSATANEREWTRISARIATPYESFEEADRGMTGKWKGLSGDRSFCEAARSKNSRRPRIFALLRS
jgi:hypothetical protein